MRHRADLDGGYILSGQEEPHDLVTVNALYSSVQVEVELVLWEEKGSRRMDNP